MIFKTHPVAAAAALFSWMRKAVAGSSIKCPGAFLAPNTCCLFTSATVSTPKRIYEEQETLGGEGVKSVHVWGRPQWIMREKTLKWLTFILFTFQFIYFASKT